MFYNPTINQAQLYVYRFFSTNNGVLHSTRDVQIVMPESYSLTTMMGQEKLLFITTFAILILASIVTQLVMMRSKIRSAIMYRVNQFSLSDFVMIVQQAVGLVIICYFYYLFFTVEHYGTFSVPFPDESAFQVWSNWAFQFKLFTYFLVVEAPISLIALLLILSKSLPSLGILFETLQRAKTDLFYFSVVAFTCLLMMAVSCNSIFGEHSMMY